jgi:hypothetical protein
MDFAHFKPSPRNQATPMSLSRIKAILTDSHFLVPLIVFCIGLALLIALH